MILIYFIMMVIMGYASEKNENTKQGEWEVKDKTVTVFCVFILIQTTPKTNKKFIFYVFTSYCYQWTGDVSASHV